MEGKNCVSKVSSNIYFYNTWLYLIWQIKSAIFFNRLYFSQVKLENKILKSIQAKKAIEFILTWVDIAV